MNPPAFSDTAAPVEPQIDNLIHRVRADIARVHDASFRSLLETTAEVLAALKTAYRHDEERNGNPSAGGNRTPDAREREEYHRTHLSPH